MNLTYQQIKVLKNDGSIEKYDPGKIARVITAAGLEPDEAAILAAKISEWATLKNQPTIKSTQIRRRVIKELRKADKFAANLFIWYKKNQDSTFKNKG